MRDHVVNGLALPRATAVADVVLTPGRADWGLFFATTAGAAVVVVDADANNGGKLTVLAAAPDTANTLSVNDDMVMVPFVVGRAMTVVAMEGVGPVVAVVIRGLLACAWFSSGTG
jgi:hypothetical protein